MVNLTAYSPMSKYIEAGWKKIGNKVFSPQLVNEYGSVSREVVTFDGETPKKIITRIYDANNKRTDWSCLDLSGGIVRGRSYNSKGNWARFSKKLPHPDYYHHEAIVFIDGKTGAIENVIKDDGRIYENYDFKNHTLTERKMGGREKVGWSGYSPKPFDMSAIVEKYGLM